MCVPLRRVLPRLCGVLRYLRVNTDVELDMNMHVCITEELVSELRW